MTTAEQLQAEMLEAQSRRNLVALLLPFCWTWSGELNYYGYGVETRGGVRRMAHRAEYERRLGEIPPGLVLDHLCLNRACCNPAHLSVVTRTVNVDRGRMVAGTGRFATHCKHGHAWVQDNIFFNERGLRVCKKCVARTRLAHRARMAAAS